MRPAILYKYRADNDFTAKIINDREIWLATAGTLNDPLECQTGTIPEEWKRREIQKAENAQLMGLLFDSSLKPVETLFSLDRRQTKKWLKGFAKLPHDRKMRRMRELYRQHGCPISNPAKMFDDLERQLATVGIFSLSASDTQQLMWAHYADSHKGLAFGFAVEDGSPLADPQHLIEVTYDDDKPVFSEGYLREVSFHANAGGGVRSISQFSFDDPVFRASISTKPREWAYEQEWRYVHERAGAHALPATLASVTFGLRMPADRRSVYKEFLHDRGFEVKFKEFRRSSSGAWETGPARVS